MALETIQLPNIYKNYQYVAGLGFELTILGSETAALTKVTIVNGWAVYNTGTLTTTRICLVELYTLFQTTTHILIF